MLIESLHRNLLTKEVGCGILYTVDEGHARGCVACPPATCERGLFAMSIFVVDVLFSYSYRGEDIFFEVSAAFRDEDAAEHWGCNAPARLADAREQAGAAVRHLVRAEGEIRIRRMPLY